jgi:WD40 repeat protein
MAILKQEFKLLCGGMFIFAVILGTTLGAGAQSKKPSVWQQIKDAAKQGRQPAAQQQRPQQQNGQQGQGPPRQGSSSAQNQINGSGPFKPPAGTKMEEKMLAPVQEDAKFEISPHGVHVATIENEGSRAVVWYDGVEGPKFDQIIPQDSNYSIVFSPDGNRYAYCAQSGNQYVVMVDGKELVRSSESSSGSFPSGSCKLGFTSNSKHVFYISEVVISSQRGKNFKRFWFDGKPSPTGSAASGVAFSPDGDHYAYILTISDLSHPDRYELIVDGKIAPYVAGNLQWTNDSKHLYTQRSLPNSGATELLYDGKPIARAFNFKIYIAPVGDMVVMAVTGGTNGHPVSFLVVNGKKVPGSETVERGMIENVIISPDGKHYAALCYDISNHRYVIADGKRGEEYTAINNLAFTGDSSAAVYQAIANNKMFVVVGDHEFGGAGVGALVGPVIAPAGDHVAASMTVNGRASLLLDGKPVPVEGRSFGSMNFSPDGKHLAFVDYDGSTGGHLMIDTTRVGEAGFNNDQIDPANSRALPYIFSPDSQHVAYLAQTGGAHGVAVDGTFIATPGTGNTYLRFSPDSKHLFWLHGTAAAESLRVIADGKPIVDFSPVTRVLQTTPQWWDFNPDGSVSFLAQDDNSLKRITVTLAPESSVETLLGQKNTATQARQ